MRLTKEQAIIITGFTGVMACHSFSDFQEAVDNKLGITTYTHMFGSKEFANKIKEAYREDFLALIPEDSK